MLKLILKKVKIRIIEFQDADSLAYPDRLNDKIVIDQNFSHINGSKSNDHRTDCDCRNELPVPGRCQ